MPKYAKTRKKARSASKRAGRNAHGGFSVLAIAFAVILVPLGLLAYDVSSARLQFNQLQAATDAAALAAACWLSNPDHTDLPTAKQIALNYFQKNSLISGSLSGATQNDNAGTDTLTTAGASELGLVKNSDGTITVKTAFGLVPSALKFLGVYTLHANATAGPALGALTGDVIMVLDYSDSMGGGTNNANNRKFARTHTKDRYTTTTTVVTATTDANGSATDSAGVPYAAIGNTPNGTVTSVANPVGSNTDLTAGPTSPTSKAGYPKTGNDIDSATGASVAVTTTQTESKRTILTKNGYTDYTLTTAGGIASYFFQGHGSLTNNLIPNPDLIAYTPPPSDGNGNPTTPFTHPVTRASGLPPAGSPELSIDSSLVVPNVDPGATPTLNNPAINSPITPNTTPLMFNAMNAFYSIYRPQPYTDPATGTTYPAGPLDATGNLVTPDRVLLALLIEAKRGNLDSVTNYEGGDDAANHYGYAYQSVLQYIPGFKYVPAGMHDLQGQPTVLVTPTGPQPGFRAEYQRMALTICQPRHSVVESAHAFINYYSNPASTGYNSDIHWALVGYGQHAYGDKALASKTPPTFDPTSETSMHEWYYPYIPLNSSANNTREVLKAIDVGTLSGGTNTPDALTQAYNELTGPNHRANKSKTVILLTDGVPTVGGSYHVAQKLLAPAGINLVIVGYYECSYPCYGGVNFVKQLHKKCPGPPPIAIGDCHEIIHRSVDGYIQQQYIDEDIQKLPSQLQQLAGSPGSVSLR
jgi:Flp pilus assembly protein TadG